MADSSVINHQGYSPLHLAKRAVRYANPDPLHGWLHEALFSEIAPPPTPEQLKYDGLFEDLYPELRLKAWEQEWSLWWETIWPHIKDLSREEFNLLIMQVIPDADPRFLDRLPLPKYCDPGFTGPKHIRRRKPTAAATPNARIANAHPLLLHISGVMLYLAGLGRPGRKPKAHIDLLLAPSSRKLAEILGISRQHIMRVIKYEGGPAGVVEQLSVAKPSDGAGTAIKDGLRRGSLAHPTNTYRVFISEEAIQLARDLQARLGDPEQPESVLRSEVEWIEDPAPAPEKAVVQQWHQILQSIRSRIPFTVTLRLFRKLRPVAFDGKTLTLTGTISPQAAILLLRLRSCQIEFQDIAWLR